MFVRWLAAAALLVMVPAQSAVDRQFQYSAFALQPQDTPWPTRQWERAAPPSEVQPDRLRSAIEDLFSPAGVERFGQTNAFVLVHRGRIVAERYAGDYSCDRIGHTMSIAKMMGAVMVGVLAKDGRIDIDAPGVMPQWGPGDPRHSIRVRDLLQMSSGLRWNSDYNLDGDLIEMAFGDGFRDTAAYAASKPLAHRPGTAYQYSDGTPSIVGDIVRRKVGGDRNSMVRFLEGRIFLPAGMTTAEAEFDMKGSWYGASGMRWSPCDLARLGLLLARDGTWDGQRILPEGWVDFMRTPSPAALNNWPADEVPGTSYGAFTILYDIDPKSARIPIDTFGHQGFGGSVFQVRPSNDTILIVYGAGVPSGDAAVDKERHVRAIAAMFPAMSGSKTRVHTAQAAGENANG